MPVRTRPVVVEAVVPNDYAGPAQAQVRVSVQDVSEQDAAARTVAVALVPAYLVPGDHLNVTVDVPADSIDPRRDYTLRVHVSPSAAQTVRAGDLISYQSIPVLTHGHPPSARVALRAVK